MLRSDKNLSRVLLELVCNEFLLWGGDGIALIIKSSFLTAEGAVCTEIFLVLFPSWMLFNASFCYHERSELSLYEGHKRLLHASQ